MIVFDLCHCCHFSSCIYMKCSFCIEHGGMNRPLMRVQHLNKSTRLLFKMLQLFPGAELATVAKGGTSNHLDMTVLNLARFWSISRTEQQNDQMTEGKVNFSLEVAVTVKFFGWFYRQVGSTEARDTNELSKSSGSRCVCLNKLPIGL